MVVFIAFFQSAEDCDGAHFVWLVDHHLLEATFKSFVFFEIFLILVECGCTDAAELASRKGRFQDVGGIHRPLPFSGTHKSVDLVDEEDYLAVALGNFVHDGFQAFLEFTFIFRAGHEGAHIEREYLLRPQIFGNVAAHDALGQSLGDGGFAGAWLAYQHRVVLGSAAQNLKHAAYFVVAADYRVEFSGSCAFVEVNGIFA